MSKGIRRYGPGKYNTILDSYIHSMVLEGMGGESCGDVSEVGFAADQIELGDEEALKEVERIAAENSGDMLTQEEKDMVLDSYGAILVENEQGFVTVDYYDDEKEEELDKDWEEIEDDADTDQDGEDSEEEEEEAETEEEDAETEEA
jgi:hypothetical protein